MIHTLQEELRRILNFRTDLPLHHGLGETTGDPNEKQLTFHFRLLQAMDKLSLSICCSSLPFAPQITQVPVAPSGRMLVLNPNRTNDAALQLSPWPFDVTKIELSMPFRRLPAEPFTDVQAFRAALAAAPMERLGVSVVPTYP